MISQNMHERLLEMGRSLPSAQSPTTAAARDTYTKERASEGGTTAQGELTGQEGRNTPDSSGQQGSYQNNNNYGHH